jgi:hypothetical protein
MLAPSSPLGWDRVVEALLNEEESLMASHTTPSVSRRTALAGLGAGGLGLALAGRGHRAASAQDATPTAPTEITLVPLGRGLPTAAPGYALSLARVTFPVGSGDMPHTHPGAALVAVESGTMAMTPLEGEPALTRAGTAEAEPLALNAEVLLNPGDAVFFAGEHGDVNRNVGETPLVFLVAALYAADQPPIMFMETPTAATPTA